jgi:hypothetical protein
LSVETRIALVLRFVEGDSIEGVAQAVRMGTSSARELIEEGCQSLRRRLARQGFGWLDKEAIGRLLRAWPVTGPPPELWTRPRRLGLA